MKDIQKLKRLNTQLQKLTGEYEALKVEVEIKQKESTEKRRSINKLRCEISSIDNDKELKVSEHAIVRFFERVKGYNISEIEKEILNEDIVKAATVLGGGGTYPNDGYQVVMKNYIVTTITK